MHADNHSPRSCEASLWDDKDRGFKVTGRAVGESSLQPFGQGYFVTHTAAEFVCGGRLGRGLLEMSGPFRIPPQHFEALDLDRDHPWVSGTR